MALSEANDEKTLLIVLPILLGDLSPKIIVKMLYQPLIFYNLILTIKI